MQLSISQDSITEFAHNLKTLEFLSLGLQEVTATPSGGL